MTALSKKISSSEVRLLQGIHNQKSIFQAKLTDFEHAKQEEIKSISEGIVISPEY